MRPLYFTDANHTTITDVHLRLLAWLDEHEGVPSDVMATDRLAASLSTPGRTTVRTALNRRSIR